MFTVFTIPKAFVGHTGLIQRNALASWCHMQPEPQMILIGDEHGVEAAAKEFDAIHIPEVCYNEFRTPLVSSAFAAAQKLARYETVCYVNSDIILMSSFTKAIQSLRYRRYLMVGQRWNLNVSDQLDTTRLTWEKDILARVAAHGVLHSPWGMDYFVFRRGFYESIPPFAVGRLMWDNWLVYHARTRRVPVVDASRVVVAIHQNHEYSTDILLPDGKWNWDHPEVSRNRDLAGGHDHGYNIHDANRVLGMFGKAWPAWGYDYLQQRLYRPPIRQAHPCVSGKILKAVLLTATAIQSIRRQSKVG